MRIHDEETQPAEAFHEIATILAAAAFRQWQQSAPPETTLAKEPRDADVGLESARKPRLSVHRG